MPPTPPITADMPNAGDIQDTCKCSPIEKKVSGPHLHKAIGQVGMGSQTNTPKPTMPHSDVHRGVSFSDPVQVEDDKSSQSVDVKPPRPTPVHCALAARVHANPRLRVVPHHGRFPLARAPSLKPSLTMEPLPEPPKKNPVYKNLPGYEGDEDFGPTSEDQYTGLVLKPQKGSVNDPKPMPNFFILKS